MSYIRSTSNPEGLYIYASGDDSGKYTAEICWTVEKPLSSGRRRGMSVPLKVFEKAAIKWANQTCGAGDDQIVEVDGFTIQERHVFVKTGRVVPKNFNSLKDKREAHFLIRLGYKRDFVYLWRVTWKYVVQDVLNRK